MVSQVITSGEFLVTQLAFIIPCSTMFSYMSLPIAFHSKLQSTLIAHKWFDAPVIIFVKTHLSDMSSQLTYEISCVVQEELL